MRAGCGGGSAPFQAESIVVATNEFAEERFWALSSVEAQSRACHPLGWAGEESVWWRTLLTAA